MRNWKGRALQASCPRHQKATSPIRSSSGRNSDAPGEQVEDQTRKRLGVATVLAEGVVGWEPDEQANLQDVQH